MFKRVAQRTVRLRVLVVAAMGLGVFSIGVLPAQAKTWEPPKTVGIVDDSISFISGGAIGARFGHRYSVTLGAVPGATMAYQLPAVEAAAAGDPWAIILELGTNNADDNAPGWKTQFDNEEAAVAGQHCVVFLTVPTEWAQWRWGSTPPSVTPLRPIATSTSWIGATVATPIRRGYCQTACTRHPWAKKLADAEFNAALGDCKT